MIRLILLSFHNALNWYEEAKNYFFSRECHNFLGPTLVQIDCTIIEMLHSNCKTTVAHNHGTTSGEMSQPITTSPQHAVSIRQHLRHRILGGHDMTQTTSL